MVYYYVTCHNKKLHLLKSMIKHPMSSPLNKFLKRSAYKRGHKKCLKGGVLVVVEICVECSEVVIDVYFVVLGVQSLSVTRTSLDRRVTVVTMGGMMMIVRSG